MGYRTYADPIKPLYIETGVLQEHNGGTGNSSLDFLYERYKAIFRSKIDKATGAISLDGNAKITNSSLVNALASNISVSGPKTININTTHQYKVTNHDYMTEYSVTATEGTVSLVGDTITYTAPSIGGDFGFKVNERNVAVKVLAPHVAKPSIISPVNNASGLGGSITLTSSAFVVNNGIDTHTGSDWDIATDSNFNNIVKTTVNNSSSKESYSASGLLPNTSYYARVRHKGNSLGYSEWSNTIAFTTREKFTPTAEIAKIQAPDKTNDDYLGFSVDASNLCERIVTGRYGDDIGSASDVGSVSVFKKNGVSYQQEVRMSALSQADSAILNIASGGSVRIQTNSPSLVDQTYTSSQTVQLPADATEITITGKGGAGSSTYNPGQSATPDVYYYSYDFLSTTHVDGWQNTGTTPTSFGSPPNPSGYQYQGDYPTTYGVTDRQQFADGTWSHRTGYNTWKLVSTTLISTGQPYVAPSTTYSTGPSTTVTINTKVFTFAGGYGGEATPSTQYFYVNSTDQLGKSVAISKDGLTVITGAPNDSMSSKVANIGTIHVAKHNGTQWQPLTQITSPDTTTTNQFFGTAVAVDDTGTRIAISRVMTTTSSSRVYIYAYINNTWTLEQTITPPDNYNSMNFGTSLAFNSDATTLAIGSPANGGTGTDSSVYIYVRSGVTWTLQARVKPSTANSTNSVLGHSVALTGDGNTLVTGDRASNINGCINIFTRSGTTWTHLQKLSSSNTAKQISFGDSVSISNDGSVISVGDRSYKNNSDVSTGAVILFTKGTTNYTEDRIILASDGTVDDYFGFSQVLSPDGGSLVVGAYGDDQSSGSLYLYQ